MPTNANTFNSRVTSEALEAKFRNTFPSQAGAELVQDLFASGVIVPVVDFTSVAEGSVLASNLQTAWDFATEHVTCNNATNNLVATPGFFKVDLNAMAATGVATEGKVFIDSGLATKVVWEFNTIAVSGQTTAVAQDTFIVFLRSGDTLRVTASLSQTVDVWFRQIADVYGNLTNPLGFVSQ